MIWKELPLCLVHWFLFSLDSNRMKARWAFIYLFIYQEKRTQGLCVHFLEIKGAHSPDSMFVFSSKFFPCKAWSRLRTASVRTPGGLTGHVCLCPRVLLRHVPHRGWHDVFLPDAGTSGNPQCCDWCHELPCAAFSYPGMEESNVGVRNERV